MRGLDISQKYYETYGATMLRELFPQWEDRIACGLVGQGSECLGCDDETSRDHDFQPGFAMWLTREDEEQIGFKLMRAYGKLPGEMGGVRLERESAYGNHKQGVFVIEDFYEKLTGLDHIPMHWREWYYTPEYAFRNATNGRVFRDDLGYFSAFRQGLLYEMPEDVWKKKISVHLAFMAQAGQYNFSRCLRHGEAGAAQMALYEFVSHAVGVVYDLNRVYAPYYKWQFRLLKGLPILPELGSELEEMLCGGIVRGSHFVEERPEEGAFRRAKESPGESDFRRGEELPGESDFRRGEELPGERVSRRGELAPNMTEDLIEKVCGKIVGELQRQGLSLSDSASLEAQAFSVMDGIENREIRCLHVME